MTDLTNISVVIVEDDPFIAADLEAIIEDAGGKVEAIFMDLESAIEGARSHDPDLFTLDFELGKETTLSVAKILKDRGSKFVIISGKDDLVRKLSGFEDINCLGKPIDPDRLVKSLRAIVD